MALSAEKIGRVRTVLTIGLAQIGRRILGWWNAKNDQVTCKVSLDGRSHSSSNTSQRATLANETKSRREILGRVDGGDPSTLQLAREAGMERLMRFMEELAGEVRTV